MTSRRLWVMLPALLVSLIALVAVAAWPQLSARTSGEEIRLRVEPIDPMDPFRGAYVALSYPDLQITGSDEDGQGRLDDGKSGTVYITLREDGDYWVADDWTRQRPSDETYLRCSDSDWQLKCGIESWFVPQDKATALEEAIIDGDVVATVKVDGDGNAAVVDVSEE